MSDSCPSSVSFTPLYRIIVASLVAGAITCAHLGSMAPSKVRIAITEEAWIQIKEGMSRRQVIEIIGVASGAYHRFPILYKGDISFWGSVICERYNPEIWTGDDAEIIVCFDDTGIVRHSFYRLVYCDKRNIIARLLDP